jgi:hypothetical protein
MSRSRTCPHPLPILLLLVLTAALSVCQSSSSQSGSQAGTAPTVPRFAAVKLVQRNAQSGEIPAGKSGTIDAARQLRAAPAQSAQFTTRMVFGPPQGGAAQCGAGQIVTGGGYSFAQGQTAIAVNTLAPDASGWGICAAGGYRPVSVTVWAVCVIAPPSS